MGIEVMELFVVSPPNSPPSSDVISHEEFAACLELSLFGVTGPGEPFD